MRTSRYLRLISIPTLDSLAGGKESEICLKFQASFFLENKVWAALLLLLHKQVYTNSIKQHFAFSA